MSAKEEKDREDRIIMEIVVDAYDSVERAMGWYYYLQDKLSTPFKAKCIVKRAVSPLKVGDVVEVVAMPPEFECEREMFVVIEWEDDELAVPLSQLKPSRSADPEIRQAVEDWHYWVKRGYQF